MFTAENFRHIFDRENRKGIDLVSRYFSHLNSKTDAIREKVSDIRALRKKKSALPPHKFEEQERKLKTDLSELKADKSAAIDLEMEKLSAAVAKPEFKLQLDQKMGPNAKLVYCVDGSAETFFVGKLLQRNINRIYGVKQANRHDLTCRIRDTINSGFPFELVRTDISSFYESIDRKRLYEKLDQDQLLSSSSKRFVKQILDSYEKLSGRPTGIPRGVGISAYLAELFLRPVDREIKNIQGNVLYCRYVDDIVAIFIRPPTGDAPASYEQSIIEILAANGLKHNANKTTTIDLGVTGGVHHFEYLGYSFAINSNILSIAPSDAKVDKLKKRLEATFEAYSKTSHISSREAFRTLVARVKFLTGNTRLMNSKSSATTGIYYNNPLITDFSKLEQLDTALKKHINTVKRPSLRNKLKTYKFKKGFVERRFHNFNSRELAIIVRAWKHA